MNSDPRVYFAAERTLLARVRSGLKMIAMGFVVARFGLFVALVTAPHAAPAAAFKDHWPSGAPGIALVPPGAGTIVAALKNHRLFIRSLPSEDIPALPMPWLTSLFAVPVAALGLLPAEYLLVT